MYVYYMCTCVFVGLADIRAKQIKKQYEERLRQARERGEVIEEPSESSSSSDSDEELENEEENGIEDIDENENEEGNETVPSNDDTLPPPLEDAPEQGEVRGK